MAERATLPRGDVTFVFTDIEGSTKLFHELGDVYVDVLDTHNAVIRAAIAAHDGVEVKTEGDAFFVAFADPAAGVAACLDMQRELAGTTWPHGRPVRVRVGVHTGAVLVIDDDYVGLSVHEAARISAAAHGGQVLVSEETAARLDGLLPPAAGLRDLGRHALKDFPQVRRLFQLTHPELVAAFPAPRTLTARGHNLAAQPTSFVGRDDELAELQRLLVGDARLVTLTGPGGIGKSRLAIEAGWSLLSWFREGVWFVGLAAVRRPEAIVLAINDALGLADQPGISAFDVLRARLSSGPTLLVVDNFEQVLDGATVVSDLLGACPELRVLATSRERLRLRGEHQIALDPLALPNDRESDPAAAEATSAVRLFAQRAKAARSAFAVDASNINDVVSICRRLDGVPLALELAAARVTDFDTPELAARLAAALDVLTEGERDLPARQQSIRSTIGWSYDLLQLDQQQLLELASVFAGGFDLTALTSVAALAEGDARRVADSLVEKNLVRAAMPVEGEAPRWWLLEAIRQYAAEQLELNQARADGARQNHTAAFLALASAAETELTGPTQLEWLARLERDHDNLRLALERGANAERLRLCAALVRFWSFRGHWTEGRAWLERAVSIDGPVSDRLLVLLGAGHLAEQQGDLELAQSRFDTGVAAAAEVGDAGMGAQFLNQLGRTLMRGSQVTEAVATYRRALNLAETTEEDRLVGLVLQNLGMALASLAESTGGAFDDAIAALADAADRFARAGDHRELATVQFNRALIAAKLDHLDDARVAGQRTLEAAEVAGNPRLSSEAHRLLALVAEAENQIELAREHFVAALKIQEDLGDRFGAATILHLLSRVTPGEDGVELARRAASIYREVGQTEYAEAIEGALNA